MNIYKWPEAYLWYFQHKPFKNGVPYLLKPEGSLKLIKIINDIVSNKFLGYLFWFNAHLGHRNIEKVTSWIDD